MEGGWLLLGMLWLLPVQGMDRRARAGCHPHVPAYPSQGCPDTGLLCPHPFLAPKRSHMPCSPSLPSHVGCCQLIGKLGCKGKLRLWRSCWSQGLWAAGQPLPAPMDSHGPKAPGAAFLPGSIFLSTFTPLSHLLPLLMSPPAEFPAGAEMPVSCWRQLLHSSLWIWVLLMARSLCSKSWGSPGTAEGHNPGSSPSRPARFISAAAPSTMGRFQLRGIPAELQCSGW